MSDSIYYLTGRGGQLNKGLGEAILERGYKLSGREMSGAFDKLAIQTQIDLITQDLQDGFWQKDSKVIAVSYGAYLLLQVLAELEPYVGSILLLSPVLGGVADGAKMHYFSPPRSGKLTGLIDNKQFPVPNDIEIHVGDNDWQSPFKRAVQFAEAMNGQCNVVSNAGHQLGKDYVALVLDRWF
jgi:predicted alpha/beta hydrolase family esterase